MRIYPQKEKKVYDGFKVAIGDTRGFTEYKNGGVLTQVRAQAQAPAPAPAHAPARVTSCKGPPLNHAVPPSAVSSTHR